MVQDAAELSEAWYATHAWRAKLGYWGSESLLVIFGAATPVSTAISSDPIFPAVLGGAVVVVTGLRRIFNWQEDWSRFTGVCAVLETERTKFKHGRQPYNKTDQAENEAQLAMKVREIEEAETQGWIVLRKSSSGDSD
jgi:hypothetical protein